MKKQILFVFIMSIAGMMTLQAQPGGRFQAPSVEERVQRVHQKLDSAFSLSAAQLVQTDSLFAQFYRNNDKVREELRAGGGRPDRELMREKMQAHIEARDKELKVVLGEEFFRKWKDEIEPAMRQRPMGGNRQ